MGLSYTSAAERGRPAPRGRRLDATDLLLFATTCLAAVAILLAYVGRIRATDLAVPSAPVVNLNTVSDVGPLDAALRVAFPNDHDRRFAAAQLLRFLVDDRSEGRTLPNVGAVIRTSVRAVDVDRTRNLDRLAARLRQARETAAHDGTRALEDFSLFTSADLSALKPSLVVRTRDAFRGQVVQFGAMYLIGFLVASAMWRLCRIQGDRLLLAVVHLLTAIGFAVLLSRPDPLRDSLLFVRYAEGIAVGLVLMMGVSLIRFRTVNALELSYLPLIGAFVLSLLLLAFGSGPGGSAAKVNLGPVQPIEAIRLLLALFLAGYFARRWELLRALRSASIRGRMIPRWLGVPRLEYLLPVVCGVGLALLFFFFQKDLGPALFICTVFLAVYAIARGRAGLAIAGLLLLVAGFYFGYLLQVSSTLATRVRMWQSPWDNAVPGGNQVTHAIWAMATGGTVGTGLGLGETRYLPAGHTDLILATIGEELGAVGLVVVAVLYAILTWRGLRVARLAASDYGVFLAMSLTLFLIVPVLIMASGIMGLTPLTGVVIPFLSYGGSAMAANFVAIGALASIRTDLRPAADFTPFRAQTRWLAGVLGATALVLVGVTINVQVIHADELVVRPHLGIQADGGRRFEYNPRVMDLVRRMPRGSVLDRDGLPLATDDPALMATARQPFAAFGVSVDNACPGTADRCYPLGARAFHLLGDARTRVNWSAPNSSYIERDAEDRLRGFEDHELAIQTTDATGRPMLTVRRDYRQLVPALRHRYEPAHPAVIALSSRPRDVHTTIDANLQFRVANIIADYARRADGRAAAVVIDPDTGELLASASYPWPSGSELAATGSNPGGQPSGHRAIGPLGHQDTGSVGHWDTDATLDRARYGLYPPGSTFKLVIEAAALREGLDPGATTFTCSRLADGRVGAHIAGWGRTVRDDVMDKNPHGTIDMHDGLVHSCNAYFAQLAVKLGPKPLLDVATRLGLSLTPSTSVLQRVRETLPQVGYGQGDVLASPLRMARVAGAVASSGGLLDIRWDKDAPAAKDVFLDPAAAQRLASDMRDVVLAGTGRSLRTHPWRIAGKTGTAEVTGKSPHGWFVGFAPYGQASKRIAFAVVVENAGYGGASAAPAAGEIVNAAALAGLIK